MSTILCTVLSVFTPVVYAQTSAEFSDLKPTDFGYESIIRLRDKGILKGYDDGTFRPDQKVSRAEALKIIGSPLMTEAEIASKPTTDYQDVANDAWFLPFSSWASKKGVIDPASKKPNLQPGKSITRIEFLKMLFVANKVDTNAYGEVTIPLSVDVTNSKEWYYPHMRYAVSAGVSVAPKSGQLSPTRELTRTDVAVLMDRFIQFQEGKRSQFLLDQTRTEIETTLDALEKNDLKRAEYASIRSLLTSRGAHSKAPEETATKVAVKTSESIRALVRAYKAGVDNKMDDVVKLSQDAWYIADQARKISPAATTIAVQIQEYAKTFAQSARKQ